MTKRYTLDHHIAHGVSPENESNKYIPLFYEYPHVEQFLLIHVTNHYQE